MAWPGAGVCEYGEACSTALAELTAATRKLLDLVRMGPAGRGAPLELVMCVPSLLPSGTKADLRAAVERAGASVISMVKDVTCVLVSAVLENGDALGIPSEFVKFSERFSATVLVVDCGAASVSAGVYDVEASRMTTSLQEVACARSHEAGTLSIRDRLAVSALVELMKRNGNEVTPELLERALETADGQMEKAADGLAEVDANSVVHVIK